MPYALSMSKDEGQSEEQSQGEVHNANLDGLNRIADEELQYLHDIAGQLERGEITEDKLSPEVVQKLEVTRKFLNSSSTDQGQPNQSQRQPQNVPASSNSNSGGDEQLKAKLGTKTQNDYENADRLAKMMTIKELQDLRNIAGKKELSAEDVRKLNTAQRVLGQPELQLSSKQLVEEWERAAECHLKALEEYNKKKHEEDMRELKQAEEKFERYKQEVERKDKEDEPRRKAQDLIAQKESEESIKKLQEDCDNLINRHKPANRKPLHQKPSLPNDSQTTISQQSPFRKNRWFLIPAALGVTALGFLLYRIKNARRIITSKNSWMNWRTDLVITPESKMELLHELDKAIIEKYKKLSYKEFLADINNEIGKLDTYLFLSKLRPVCWLLGMHKSSIDKAQKGIARLLHFKKVLAQK